MRKLIRLLLLVMLVLLGITAFGGGLMLIQSPDGQSIQLPLEWIKETVFGSYFVPGLVLFLILGLGSFVVAGFVYSAKSTQYYLLAVAQGLAVLIWLAVQLIVIRQTFFLQAVYAVIGLVITLLALWLYKNSNQNN